jgi:hypothetical protein
MATKLNSFWIGILCGLIFPLIMYVGYYAVIGPHTTFPVRFTRYLINGYMLSNVIKICGLGNLLLFYVGIRKNMDSFNKGIIVSILLYIGLIAYVNYQLEPQLM